MPPCAAAARPTSRSYGSSQAGPTTSTSHGAETTAQAEKGEPAIGRTEETREGLTPAPAEASGLLSSPYEEICRFSARPAKALAALCGGRCRATPTTVETSITETRQETGRKVTAPARPKRAGVTGARQEDGRTAICCMQSTIGEPACRRKVCRGLWGNRECFAH